MAKKPRQSIAPSAKTPIDFKVDPSTGIGYISQRKAAELCGVAQSTISRLINASPNKSTFTNENNQLSEAGFETCITYALGLGKPEAAKLASKLIRAGIRAFIYSQAGVKVQIAQQATEQLVLQLQDENAKLKSEAAANALSVASLKCNKAVRHTELQGLVERGIATCTQKVVTRYKYGLTREGREEGFTQNSNGTILYPPAP